MQNDEQGRVQLAPRGETTWNHSVSMYEGSLALWWEVRDDQGNVETKMRTFTNAETEVFLTFLYDNRESISHPGKERRV